MIVNTIVFLEVGTTSLPSDEGKETKIIEISLLAVKRNHFLFANPAVPPRIQSKLTFCLNPKKPITNKDAARKYHNGKNNHKQEGVVNDNFYEMIMNFLEIQYKPVSFVSHFGLALDYPLLQNQLKKLNKSLPADILYVDSYDLFRSIFPTLSSYKLSEIYKEFMLSAPSKLHTSAIDCRLLMLSGLTIKRSFIQYIDANCRPFAEIAPMEIGISLFSDARRKII